MRRFLLFILTLIIIPTTLFLIITWTTFITINNPSFIKQTLASHGTYFKISSILSSYLNQQENDPFLFSREQKDRVAKAAITEKLAKEKIEPIIDNYYNWLNKSQPLKIEIDLKSIKESAKQEITSIYKEKYASLAECTQSELLLAKIQSNNQDAFPTCRIPSDNQFDSLYDNFDASVTNTTALDNIPDKIIIPSPQGANTIPDVFQKIRSLLIIISITDLILLFLAFYLLSPHKKALFRYFSTLTIIFGLAILTIQYFAMSFIQNEINGSISYALTKNTQIRDMILPIITFILTQLKNNLYLIGFILIISGIIFLIITLILKNKPKPNIQIIKEDQIKSETKL